MPLTDRPQQRRLGLLALAALVAVGIVLALWRPVSPRLLLDWGRGLTASPWTAVALVALQALLLALALPGTLMLWVVAPFYAPLPAAAILTLGSAVGNLGAYAIARRAGSGWRPGARGGRIMDLLARRGDFYTQLVLRLLPGFPHSAVNYGAGFLGLPLGSFVLAAALGLAVKWAVYAAAIHALVAAGAEGEPPGAGAVGVLLLAALLAAAGAALRQWLNRRR